MASQPESQFEVVGDPADLPDAFFDAIATLLIDLQEKNTALQKDAIPRTVQGFNSDHDDQ